MPAFPALLLSHLAVSSSEDTRLYVKHREIHGGCEALKVDGACPSRQGTEGDVVWTPPSLERTRDVETNHLQPTWKV